MSLVVVQTKPPDLNMTKLRSKVHHVINVCYYKEESHPTLLHCLSDPRNYFFAFDCSSFKGGVYN